MSPKNLRISFVGKTIPSSPIRKLATLAEKAKSRGIKVYHLNVGDPDIPPSPVFLKAIKNFKGKLIPYPNSQGDEDFLKSLIWYYHRLGIKNIDKDNLHVTSGASEAILWALSITTNPGEEIIVFEPFYSPYKAYAKQTGIKLVPITTSIENGFHLPPDRKIIEKISLKTKAILVCSPNNPTGTALTKEEMKRIVKIARRRKLWLLSDETYREIVFDGRKPISFLNFNEYKEGIVVIESLSKAYSLCGLRIGALVSKNKEFIQTALKYSQARLGAGFLDQEIGAKLNKVSKTYFVKRRLEFQKRRGLLFNLLNQIEGVFCPKPEGAFYLLVKLPVKDAEHFCKWLLTNFNFHKETIMVTPAADFYQTKGLGKDEIRIAYVLNISDLTKSIQILKEALKVYPQYARS